MTTRLLSVLSLLCVALFCIYNGDPLVAMAVVIGVPSPILQTTQNRRLFTSSMVPNTTDRWYSPDFPRSLYAKLILRLSGSLTKTESVAGVLADNCLSLIRSIRIKADGDALKEFEPSTMRVLSHHIFRGIDTDVVNISLGTDTGEPFSARLIVDMQSPRTRLPEASLFPGDRYGELAMEIDWGAYTDLVGTGTYTGPAFVANPTLEVWGEEILDPNLRARPYLIHKCFTKTFARNATAMVGDSFQLPVGETYRGILFKQLTRTPDLGVATLLAAAANIVIRVNGSYRKTETTWGELVARNKSTYGVALPTGYAFLDFMEDGDFNKALRTGDSVGVTQVEVLADVSSLSGGFLQLLGLTYKAARQAA